MDLLTPHRTYRRHVPRDHYFCELVYQHGLAHGIFFNDLLGFLESLVFATSWCHAVPPLPCGTFPPRISQRHFIYGLSRSPEMYRRVWRDKHGRQQRTSHVRKVRDQINEQTFVFLLGCGLFLACSVAFKSGSAFLHPPRDFTDISLNKHGLGFQLVASKLF